MNDLRLILGSAATDLFQAIRGEFAERIEYVNPNPLDMLEAATDADARTRLWVRGGLLDSFLVDSDADSLAYRRNFHPHLSGARRAGRSTAALLKL
jgi:hypothetical protein